MEDSAGPTIGVVSPYLAGNFFGSLISGVQRVAAAAGGRVIAITTASLGADHVRHIPRGQLPPLAWERVSGFISIANAVPVEYLEALGQGGKPVVTLSYQQPGISCPAVVSDNRGGVRRSVEHLVQHGHRAIAFGGALDRFDAQERFASYQEALVAQGIEPNPGWFFESGESLEPGGRQVARDMIAAGLPCTAVIAANDLIAVGIMEGLKEAGYRLPRDQAVIGFDDMPGVGLLCPSLSSVSQCYEEMATLAGRLLLEQVEGRPVEPITHVVETLLMLRESCGCVGGPPVEELPAGGAAPGQATGSGRRSLLGAQVSTGPLAQALARTVEEAFAKASTRELTSLELFELAQSCVDIYALSPSQLTYDEVLAWSGRLYERSYQEVQTSEDDRARTQVRLERCMTEVRLALARGLLNQRNEAYYELRQGVRDEHAISMNLLHGHKEDPRSLAWLARTDVVAAVLGLWRQDGDCTELDVSGTFDVGGDLALASKQYATKSFPPHELFERAGPHDAVLVFPVRNEERYWGLLAVVVPVNWSFLNRETVFQWEDLLCEALSYQDVVRTLNDRSDQLARSYERERKLAQVATESEERYALAARAANDGLWDWDMVTGSIFYSARWKRLLGYPAHRVGPSPQEWLGRAHPDDLPGLMAAVESVRLGHASTLSYEHRISTADGSYRWFLCRGLPVPGGGAPAKKVVGSLTDITERRSLEERLRYQALHDGLTGLPNRTLFLDRLAQAMAAARRRPDFRYAVLWLDLDGFKVLNDSLGHVFGDKLLVQVADRVRSHVRETDTAARFGGDEFALLLQGVEDMATIGALARRLLEHLNEPYDLDGHRVVATASIGIATSSTHYDDPEDVLRDADIAMYKAKSLERGTFATFDSSMHAVAMERLRTETQLRDAVELGQLELHYQPVVDLTTGRVRGLEALVRWNKPGIGLVPPLNFLPVAEESGLIVPIGYWVQQTAASQLAEWQASGVVGPMARIGINLSNREFWAPRLFEQLDAVLEKTGIDPVCVVIEITEGVVMSSLDHGVKRLQELHARGLLVSIDDFGTGYSSLEALHRLPIDSLKMDRSFVVGLGNSARAVELARTIIQMGKNLGLAVVAEGIETTAQRQALVELGCPGGQGYFFSRPLPAVEAGELLASRGRNRQVALD